MNRIKIVIVDDQTLMRDGLKTILNLEEDMEVIGVADNGKKGVELVKDLMPDLVLMDIRMPELNGVEATKIIKIANKDIVVLMLTTFDDEDYIIDALCYGASGYLLKDIHGDNLIQNIRGAYRGNIMLPANIAAKLAVRLSKVSSEIRKESGEDINALELTEREKDIGQLLVKGFTNKEIADSLFISLGTVKNYITNIYDKIGVDNRAAAVLFLKKLGL